MFAGVVLSVTASLLFGLLSYYSVLLLPLNGYGIVAWRVLFTALILLLVMSAGRYWLSFVADITALRQRRYGIPALLAGTALLSVQLTLFGWAPVNGEGQALAMGYFMLPLTLVLSGRIFYRERLSGMQKTALLFALAGVVAGLINSGGFSPVSLLVMLGYPPYFLLRKRLPLNALNGIFTEHLLLIPVAVSILLCQDFNPVFFTAHEGYALFWLTGLGLISAAALLAYMAASRSLPMVLFGLLSYVEPLALFVVALMLGEPLRPADLWTYIPIWLAVLCLMLEGGRQMLRTSVPARVT